MDTAAARSSLLEPRTEMTPFDVQTRARPVGSYTSSFGSLFASTDSIAVVVVAVVGVACVAPLPH
eukprot:2157016-Alexandrium_andersonii.AAC.1